MIGAVRSLYLVGLLWVAAVAVATAADFYRIRLDRDTVKFDRLLSRYRTVLAIPGKFVDALLSPEEAQELRRQGARLEFVQSDPEGWMKQIAADPQRGIYRTSQELTGELERLARSRPGLVRLEKLGEGWERGEGGHRRPIWALGVFSERAQRERRPAVLFLGGVHARELATTDVLAELAVSLAGRYETDPVVRDLLDTRRLWIVPLLNPDGREYVLGVDPWWRKNRHAFAEANAVGVDLNRNFPFHWSSGVGSSDQPGSAVYRGEGPSSEPETASLVRFVERVSPVVSLSFHSYGEYVLTPYGYPGREPEDPLLYRAVEKALSGLTGYAAGTVGGLLGYHSSGRHDDWLYGTRRVVSVEIELGRTFFPLVAELDRLSRLTSRACVYMARIAGVWLEAELVGVWGAGGIGGPLEKVPGREAPAPRAKEEHRGIRLRIGNLGIPDARQIRWRLDAGPGVELRPASGLIPRIPGLGQGAKPVELSIETSGTRLTRASLAGWSLRVVEGGHDRVVPLECRDAGLPLE